MCRTGEYKLFIVITCFFLYLRLALDKMAASRASLTTRCLQITLLIFTLALGCFCVLAEYNGKYITQYVFRHLGHPFGPFRGQQPDARFAIGVYKEPLPDEILAKYRTWRTSKQGGGKSVSDLQN